MVEPAGEKNLIVLAQMNQIAASDGNGEIEGFAAGIFIQIDHPDAFLLLQQAKVFSRSIRAGVVGNQQFGVAANGGQITLDTLFQEVVTIPVENDGAEHDPASF